MFVEVKRLGEISVRNTVPVLLRPEHLLDTNFDPRDEVYIAYGKDMIVICKKLNIVKKLAEKDFVVIIESKRHKKQ